MKARLAMGHGWAPVLARCCLHVCALKMEVAAPCPLQEGGTQEASSVFNLGCLDSPLWKRGFASCPRAHPLFCSGITIALQCCCPGLGHQPCSGLLH